MNINLYSNSIYLDLYESIELQDGVAEFTNTDENQFNMTDNYMESISHLFNGENIKNEFNLNTKQSTFFIKKTNTFLQMVVGTSAYYKEDQIKNGSMIINLNQFGNYSQTFLPPQIKLMVLQDDQFQKALIYFNHGKQLENDSQFLFTSTYDTQFSLINNSLDILGNGEKFSLENGVSSFFTRFEDIETGTKINLNYKELYLFTPSSYHTAYAFSFPLVILPFSTFNSILNKIKNISIINFEVDFQIYQEFQLNFPPYQSTYYIQNQEIINEELSKLANLVSNHKFGLSGGIFKHYIEGKINELQISLYVLNSFVYINWLFITMILISLFNQLLKVFPQQKFWKEILNFSIINGSDPSLLKQWIFTILTIVTFLSILIGVLIKYVLDLLVNKSSSIFIIELKNEVGIQIDFYQVLNMFHFVIFTLIIFLILFFKNFNNNTLTKNYLIDNILE
jgi:hypothetical protein